MIPARAAMAIFVFAAAIASRAVAIGDEEKVAWLGRHAVALSGIEPGQTDFTDLAPLAEKLDDAQVVMLGEATRGDGTAFLAKTRLVRYLHERLGFDLLVLEGGFWDCDVAWRAIAAGADPRRALQGAVLPLYIDAEQFQPLLALVAESTRSLRPLEIAGMDDQTDGVAGDWLLLPQLREQLARFHSLPSDATRWDELVATLEDVFAERYATGEKPVPRAGERRRLLQTLEQLRQGLEDAAVEAEAEDDRSFWLQVIANLKSYAEGSWRLGKWVPGEAMDPEVNSIRFRQMGANLVWLARERHPTRRIIVWSLDVQLARDLDRISTGDVATRERFARLSTIGDAVARELGEKAYTIGFTALRGTEGSAIRRTEELLPPTKGSFEDLMARTGLPAAFVDLRRIPRDGSWLRRALIARPISYKELLAIWPRHFDGLIFLRDMEPVRRIER